MLKEQVERFEERLQESGRKHQEISVELHGIMSDARTLLKTADAAPLLAGTGGVLAHRCSALDEGEIDEWHIGEGEEGKLLDEENEKIAEHP